MSAAPKPVVYSALKAAKVADVSPTTIHKAIHATGTDPNSYPPPLTTAGRHGERGKWAIRHDDLMAWIDSLRRFG